MQELIKILPCDGVVADNTESQALKAKYGIYYCAIPHCTLIGEELLAKSVN